MGLQYVARKRMKVAGRTVEPGEVVPEAATWKNVKAYVNDGSLAVAVEVPEGTVENAELKVQVADLSERLAALERLVTGAGEQDGDVGVVEGTEGEDGIPQTSTDTETGSANNADQGEVLTPLDLDSLDNITRAELDAQATALGIADAPKLANKRDVAGAINEAIANREAQP